MKVPDLAGALSTLLLAEKFQARSCWQRVSNTLSAGGGIPSMVMLAKDFFTLLLAGEIPRTVLLANGFFKVSSINTLLLAGEIPRTVLLANGFFNKYAFAGGGIPGMVLLAKDFV